MSTKQNTMDAAVLPGWMRGLTHGLGFRLRALAFKVAVPSLAFAVFLALWSTAAQRIVTKYGTLPTPADVWHEAGLLIEDHRSTRRAAEQFELERARDASEQQRYAAIARAKAARASGSERAEFEARAVGFDKRAEQLARRKFSASPTYVDQILTSIKTVFFGFVVASLIAIPIGILCGMSRIFQAAVNPMVQIFKPVSPLAWLPIGLLVFKAANPAAIWVIFISSIWPMIINTAAGVREVPQDYLNVAKVLNLSEWKVFTRILFPAVLPFMLTGIRLAIGVAWLVIVAAEMLTGGVGIGFWVWDEWNNLNVEHIIIAIFTVGIVGLMLEQALMLLARRFEYR